MTAIYIQCHDGKLTEFYLHDLVNTIQTPASPCPWSEGWEATKWSLPCSPAYQQLHPFPKQSLSLSRSQSTATGCSVCLRLINLQSMDLSIHKSFKVSQIKIYPYFLSPATLGTSTLHFSIHKCKTTYIEKKSRTPNKKRSSSFFFPKTKYILQFCEGHAVQYFTILCFHEETTFIGFIHRFFFGFPWGKLSHCWNLTDNFEVEEQQCA